MSAYEVRVEKHWQGKKYNVSLVSWERNGSGMTSGRAFEVPLKKAADKLKKQSNKVTEMDIVKEMNNE